MEGMTTASRADDAAQRETGDLNALLSGDAHLQSQFDKLVSKALQTARGNWEREQGERDAQAEKARNEAFERELAKRESALRKRELRADAAAMLGARGLPSELIDCVDANSADTLEASVAKLERAFNTSVEAALRFKLSGSPPEDGGGRVSDSRLRRAMGLKTE